MWRLALAVLLATGWWTAAAAEGEQLFVKRCAACHQQNGRGLPGIYPPLVGHIGQFLRVPEGRPYLVRVVAFGLWGIMVVEGRPYRGFMPPQPKLSDAQIAAVLNYVLRDLEPDPPADFTPYTAAEVADYRQRTGGPTEVLNERHALLLKLRARAEGVDRIPLITGSAEDYSRNCQGCHRADGMGAPGAVPRLQRFVGYFTHVPEGRAYIAIPPAHMLPHLDDARFTAVLNWTVLTFSRDELAPDFRPFTAEEVRRYRELPPTDILPMRERLVEKLRAAGVIQGDDDGFGPLPD